MQEPYINFSNASYLPLKPTFPWVRPWYVQHFKGMTCNFGIIPDKESNLPVNKCLWIILLIEMKAQPPCPALSQWWRFGNRGNNETWGRNEWSALSRPGPLQDPSSGQEATSKKARDWCNGQYHQVTRLLHGPLQVEAGAVANDAIQSGAVRSHRWTRAPLSHATILSVLKLLDLQTKVQSIFQNFFIQWK